MRHTVDIANAPRTSVVIPARNADTTLSQTLDSLLAQSDPDWEAIIIDDASTDGTAALIADYVQRDARFATLPGSGHGASGARNTGLSHARGRRLLFLDSDDWIDARFLEVMNAALDGEPGAAAAYCAYRRVMPDGGLGPVCRNPEIALAPVAAFARSCATAIHAIVIERDVVTRTGGFDPALRTCEDWDLWQRAAKLGGSWVYVDAPMSYYRASAHSLSADVGQMLDDARRVIAQGFSTDEFHDGTLTVHDEGGAAVWDVTAAQAHAYFALWCAGFDCGRGGEGTATQGELRDLPSTPDAAQAIVNALFEGVMVGMRVVPEQIASHWPVFETAFTRLIMSLGAMWNDPVAARRVQYEFERVALSYDDLSVMRPLALTLGLRVDLRNPAPRALPAGIDRLYVHLCDGSEVVAILDVGALGTITTDDWLEIAASQVGVEFVARRASVALLASLTPASVRTALRGGIRAARAAPWQTDVRGAMKRVARDAFTSALGVARVPDSHRHRLDAIQRDATQRVAQPSSPPVAPDSYRIDPFARAEAQQQIPAPSIERATVTSEMEDAVARHVLLGGASARRTELKIPEEHNQIPVLMYHSVASDGPAALARYRVTPEQFQAQMTWLRRNGYHTITSDELEWFLAYRQPFGGRPVVITFDVGLQNFANSAWPLLRRCDFGAQVFVVTDLVGQTTAWDAKGADTTPLMGESTIRRLAAEGVSFGSHLASHRGADGLSTAELAGELMRSREMLRQWTGAPIHAVAAPFGITGGRLCTLAAQCGYRVGYSTRDAVAQLTSNLYEVPRIEVRGDWTLDGFIARMEASR